MKFPIKRRKNNYLRKENIVRKGGKELFRYDPDLVKVRKIQDDLYELEVIPEPLQK